MVKVSPIGYAKARELDLDCRSLLPMFESFQYCGDHLIADLASFWKLRRKVACNILEFLLVSIEVSEADSLTPILLKSVHLSVKRRTENEPLPQT